jgi:galactose mutarotase-like enzyme
VKLDFGLSSSNIPADAKKAWPYEFGLVYTVTLAKDGLQTMLNVRNEGKQSFEFQMLLHTYFTVDVWSSFSLLCTTIDSNPRTSRRRRSTAWAVQPTSTRCSMPQSTSNPLTPSTSPARPTASTSRSSKIPPPFSQTASLALTSSAITLTTQLCGTHGSRRQGQCPIYGPRTRIRGSCVLRWVRWMDGRSWRLERPSRAG